MIEDERPTVFIVDDDSSMRDALRNLFRSVGLNVETFGAAQEFLARERSKGPGCLVLDIRLPSLSGLDLQRQLVDANTQIPIIFITAHGDIQMSVRAMKAGAVEFLTKPFRDQDLLDAVQQALDRDRATRISQALEAETRARYASLSPREQEVMGLVVRGLLNKQIAGKMGTSEATVKMHRGHVMRKMKVDSVVELARLAERLAVPIPENRHGTP